VAVGVALGLYLIRVFSITAFYHRYFSHRTYKTSRPAQFIFALLGASAMQKGPLWWAAQHRKHHRHADKEEDIHSPNEHGLLWSHMLWVTSRGSFNTDMDEVKDLARFPELRALNRYDWLVPLLLAGGLYLLGFVLERAAPGLGTSGMQMLIWGFFISTVTLFHATSLVNSMAHRLGSRRYNTPDQSRNNLLLALLTLGEGWHNNHHYYPATTRQGFFWWEIDVTYYLLVLLARTGLIWDLRPVPKRVREKQ
jgi:stearoyl-CoA desaturase (delta-9 desaturase)